VTEDDQRICWECFDAAIAQCEQCNDMHWRPHMWIGDSSYNNFVRIRSNIEPSMQNVVVESDIRHAADSEEWVCTDCAYQCGCGTWYSWESSYEDCCRNNNLVHNYSWNPMFRFHDIAWKGMSVKNVNPEMGKLYMGFEIEVERAYNHLEEWYGDAREDYDSPEFVYCKSDGSLGTDGVEFVTMPATLEAFEQLFPWQAFVNLQENGARAWAYENCGMHIHVSRTAFRPSHLYKFVRFQLENSGMCIDFAQRHVHWGSWNNETMVDAKKRTSHYTKRPASGARYSAINLSNWNTVELRYFRSNILPNGIRRNAQWVQAIYDYTKQLSSNRVMSQGWQEAPFVDFINSSEKYALAADYLNRMKNKNNYGVDDAGEVDF